MNETLDINNYIKEPIKENIETLYNHFGRYYYAIKKLKIDKNDIVMDLGCGEGYGSYLISQKASLVLGVDVQHEILKKASKNFASKSIFFSTYEYYKKLPFKITKIICIETIEHMKKSEIKRFFNCILSGFEGELFLSFPIGNNEPCKYNKFHKCEPSIEYIKNCLIKNNFNNIIVEVDDFKNNYGYEQLNCFMEVSK